MVRALLSVLFLFILLPLAKAAFAEDKAQPVSIAANLFRLSGTHAASGIEYVRFFTTAQPLSADAAAAPADPHVVPTFTIECTQLKNKRMLSLYVNFGRVADLSFPEPFHPTDTDLFPPRNPTLPIALIFEGYIKSKPFKRGWEQLPNGNYRYRNPGMGSGNLDDPRFFLDYLHSLPTLHVIALKPEAGKPGELYFHTATLLGAADNAPLCRQ